MKVGDLVEIKQSLYRGRGYGLIVELHGGDMAKVIWEDADYDTGRFSWEMLHDLVDASSPRAILSKSA